MRDGEQNLRGSSVEQERRLNRDNLAALEGLTWEEGGAEMSGWKKPAIWGSLEGVLLVGLSVGDWVTCVSYHLSTIWSRGETGPSEPRAPTLPPHPPSRCSLWFPYGLSPWCWMVFGWARGYLSRREGQRVGTESPRPRCRAMWTLPKADITSSHIVQPVCERKGEAGEAGSRTSRSLGYHLP